MSLTSSSWTRAFAVAAVTVLAACGDRLVEPAAVPPPAARIDAVAKGFTPLQAPKHGDLTVTAVIDGRGGLLDAPTAGNRRYGYMLTVPAGTVNRPTTFTLRVVAGERYEVELSALQGSKNVGDKLRLPVTLTVSCGDTPGHFDRTVKVYYLPADGGVAQPVPTLAVPSLGYVVGVLRHFSRYQVGID